LGKIDYCIIPAAGRGSRWAPISGYLPKEMLPLIDKPVIEWTVDEAIYSGCKNIIIVINKQKELIKKYLVNTKKHHVNIQYTFVYQKSPKGIAHAIWCCRNLIKKDVFCVSLPDLPIISKKPALKQLINVYLKEKSHYISFDKFPPENLDLYGECLTQKKFDKLIIRHFCSKVSSKKPHHKNNKIRMSGRFIFTTKIFPIIKSLLKNRIKTEITDVDALHAALEARQNVYGIKIIGHTYDTGTPKGYVRANTAFFKKSIIK